MTADAALPSSIAPPPPPRSIAVLMAAHNRRELTLRALRSLADVPAGLAVTVVLLDDASTDGTADAVRAGFPGTVILHGDGDAFWNGGMHRAWTHALALEADGYLWLNDDVALDRDALARLADAWAVHDRSAPVILVGATRDATGAVNYGGMRRRRSPFALGFERMPVADAPRPADTFNGNIVLVSGAVVARIGINDPGFFHTLGDVDYGLRATAAGIPVLLMPGTLGVCETNPPMDLAAMSFRQRWRHMNSHRGVPFANWWRVTRRHSGVWFPLHFALAYRRLVLPGRRRG